MPGSGGVRRAALGSVLFFVLAPGATAGLVPWLLTRWQMPGDVPVWRATLGWVVKNEDDLRLVDARLDELVA